MQTLDWNPKEQGLNSPKALLIGHDPRLQNSDTQAEFVFFANYYFHNSIKDRSFKKKYGLAASAINQLTHITNGKISPDEIYLTNLCNSALPHAPKGKTVYIPEDKAMQGYENIKQILAKYPGIQYVFPMSLQVNYWLQKLGLYESGDSFMELSSPKLKGVEHCPPYYEAKSTRTFLMICGNQYPVIGSSQVLIPILHAKCFPLNETFKEYRPAYERIKTFF